MNKKEIYLKSHSEELVKKVLKPWITKDDVLKEALGRVGYEGQIQTYHSKNPKLENFNQVEQHLKTGYKEIWAQWKKTLAFSQNLIDNTINIFENFKKMLIGAIDNSGLSLVKFDKDSQKPYYYPNEISYVIYLEIMRKNRTKNPLGMIEHEYHE